MLILGSVPGAFLLGEESDISLPSPDRVANLWRYAETPTKVQDVSVNSLCD